VRPLPERELFRGRFDQAVFGGPEPEVAVAAGWTKVPRRAAGFSCHLHPTAIGVSAVRMELQGKLPSHHGVDVVRACRRDPAAILLLRAAAHGHAPTLQWLNVPSLQAVVAVTGPVFPHVFAIAALLHVTHQRNHQRLVFRWRWCDFSVQFDVAPSCHWPEFRPVAILESVVSDGVLEVALCAAGSP